MRGSKQLLAFLAFALCALGFGVASATAEAPVVTAPQVSEVSYTTAHVKGEVDPKGEGTSWVFEVSADGSTWEPTNVAGFAEGSGLQPVGDEDITSLWFGSASLQPGTTYQVRLSASNESGFVTSPEPNPEFTTKALPAPTVTIDPVITFTGTTATFKGQIDTNSPAGDPAAANVDWHFQCSPECPNLSIDSSPTPNPIPADEDGAPQIVKADATGLEPNTTYEVTLVGKNAGVPVEAGPVSFKTDAVSPEAETIPAFSLEGGTSALVGGRVNPRNTATTYWIEWGRTTAYGNSSPASQDALAGSGGISQVVSQKLTELEAGTTYHFRIVAESSAGRSEGEDLTVTPPAPTADLPCPNEGFRVGPSASLPDCRAYELASLPDLGGKSARPLTGSDSKPEFTYIPFPSVAADGDAVIWQTEAILPGVDGGPTVAMYVSRRGPDGWSSRFISPPGTSLLDPLHPKTPSLVGADPDLDRFLWFVPGSTLDPVDDDPNAADLFREEPDGSFVRLSKGSQAPTVAGGVGLKGYSPDLFNIVFITERDLEPEATGKNLYLRSGSTTTLVNRDEHGTPVLVGNNADPAWVSADGSALVFQSADDLYFRDLDLANTDLIGEYGNTGPFGQTAGFEGMSSNGSKVVFITEAQATSDDEDSSLDLYEYDSVSGSLTRISAPTGAPGGPGPGNGDSAAEMLALSTDGSTAFFVSAEQLDGNRGRSGEPNLYVRTGGTTRFVTTFDPSDRASPEDPFTNGWWHRYAHLTPDGSKLLFESRARITAYDNGGYTEIYEYDLHGGEIRCVSCRPDGTPPVANAAMRGRRNSGGAFLEFAFPPIDTINSDSSGEHVFFNSEDAIVPEDVNDKYDVYEFDAATGSVSLISAGRGPGEAAFLGNSPDGRDVFFLGSASLTTEDHNIGAYKVYDARRGGGFPAVASAAPCRGEGCRGSGSPVAIPASPATGSFVGPGNPKHKHKKHKKHKKHRKHKKHHHKKHQGHAHRDGRNHR